MLISDRLWRRRFHADPDVIGRQLHFGTLTASIVGVLPASFHFSNADVDLFEPGPPDAPVAQDRASTWYNVVGRLRLGVTQQQAFADLSTIQHQLGAQFPKTDRDLAVHIEPLKAVIVGDVGSSLWLLYGAVTSCCSSPASISPRCCSPALPTASARSPSASRSAHRAAPSSRSC